MSNKYHCPLCAKFMGQINDAKLRKGHGLICSECISIAKIAIDRASESYKKPYNWSARESWEKV